MRKWIILALIAALLGSGALLHSRFDRFDQQRQNYLGLRLGATMAEAEYVLGYPEYVGEPLKDQPSWSSYLQTDGEDPKNLMEKGRKPQDYPEWNYETQKNRKGVHFEMGRQRADEISCMALDKINPRACPTLFGIRIGRTEEAVLSALGRPDSANIEGGVKTITYGTLGLELSLAKGTVYRMTKRRSSGPATLGWLIRHPTAWMTAG